MNSNAIRAVANAVLYEGYMLYPYRPTALKNRSQGWSFGTLLPASYAGAHRGEPCSFRAEVLIVGGHDATIAVEVRYLHLAAPGSGAEAVERSVTIESVSLAELLQQTATILFSSPSDACSAEPLCSPVRGSVHVLAQVLGDLRTKLTVSVTNETPGGFWPQRDHALHQSLVSAHALLTVENGEFVSLLDPPEDVRNDAQACKQDGVFPVLAGEEGERSAMLLSPIILYDYPRIATNSHGDFFDSSEIDEMLTLRVLTLTDEEKREVSQSGERARAMLERTEKLSPNDILKLHGIVQSSGGKEH